MARLMDKVTIAH